MYLSGAPTRGDRKVSTRRHQGYGFWLPLSFVARSSGIFLFWCAISDAVLWKVVADVPLFTPGPVSFFDTDVQKGQLGGILEFPKATSEVDITHYAVYWGSSPTTKLVPFVNIPKGGTDPQYSIPQDTAIPTVAGVTATHFLAFSANGDGENGNGESLQFTDRGVPVRGPQSVTFFDVDLGYPEIGGRITVVRATDETDVTDYVMYWGSSTSTQLEFVASVPKANAPVHDIPEGSFAPQGTTHIIAYTANEDGLTLSPASTSLVDRMLPVHNATSIEFLDIDLGKHEVSGAVTIGRAVDESVITGYSVYFASGSEGPKTVFIGTAPATGSLRAVTLTIPPDTSLPATATHIMVFSRSDFGEMLEGDTIPLVDRYVPVDTPTGVSFSDEDIDGGELAGTIYVTRASGNEIDITRYGIFFADSFMAELGQIAELDKQLPQLSHALVADTPKPAGAVYVLAKSGSDDGYMRTGVAAPLIDLAVPVNAPRLIEFTDTDDDAGQLGGPVTISRASDESDVTHYTIYFGDDEVATADKRVIFLGQVSPSGSSDHVVFQLGHDTSVPAGATHVLAFSANDVGEIRTGISTALVDRTGSFPTVHVPSVSFVDLDPQEGEAGGTITWFAPTVTAGLIHYNVYLAEDATGTARQQVGSSVPINTLSISLPANTLLDRFTHILVYCSNTHGEGPGQALAIEDKAVPNALVLNPVFGDTDPGIASVGGLVEWIAPANPQRPAQFTSFVVYLATNSWGDGRTFYGEVPSSQNSLPLPQGIDLVETNFTHVLVYTKNAVGEAAIGMAAVIVDKFVPATVAYSLQFFDKDLGTDEIGGTISWVEPSTVAANGAETFRVYFVKADGTGLATMLYEEVPLGRSSVAVPFNTPLANWTDIVVVAANPTGEAVTNVSVPIVDRTPDSCPSEVKHRFFSHRWRIVAGSTKQSWNVRAIRFYADSLCSDLLPGVPARWPRRPALTQGVPFASPAVEKHLYEIFKPSSTATEATGVWSNGTQASADPNAGPWWSSGAPCETANGTLGDPGPDAADSTCYVGFNWESDTVVTAAGKVTGSSGTVRAVPRAVHCVDVEQSMQEDCYSSFLVLQWYDAKLGQYRNLMVDRFASGGLTRMSYQGLLAAECYGKTRVVSR